MASLLEREDLCDVFFEVGPNDGTAEHARLGAIRGVLAARSPAFRNLLFTGEYKHKIDVAMPHWHAPAFRAMLSYTHTGRLRLDATFCVELLAIASYFGLSELRAACAQFIDQNLHHGHACYMLEQANTHDPALFDKCVEFIAWNCTEVIETDGFFNLSEEVLCKLLASDELHMPAEIDLYHAVVEWGQRRVEAEVAAGRPTRRMADVVKAPMAFVRLGLLSVKELNLIVRADAFVQPDELMDALLYHTDNLAVDLTAAKFHPRVGRFEHVVVPWDGGEVGNPYHTCGGIFHYLGCGGDDTGVHRPYSNPYPSDLLVFSSGMHDDRPGHTSDFLGLEAFVANHLGSLFTSDAENSWIAVTLKGGKQIIPTHYTLGYHEIGNDMFAPRHWELQGSLDGMKWSTLMAHGKVARPDMTLNADCRVHTWEVPYNNQKPFGHFRIFQTGPTSNSRHLLSCSGFELYGRLLTPHVDPDEAAASGSAGPMGALADEAVQAADARSERILALEDGE